jgi:hypothetical protein
MPGRQSKRSGETCIRVCDITRGEKRPALSNQIVSGLRVSGQIEYQQTRYKRDE